MAKEVKTRLDLENRLGEIEDQVEKLASNGKAGENSFKIIKLLLEYRRIEPEWKRLDQEETSERLRERCLLAEMDLFSHFGLKFQP